MPIPKLDKLCMCNRIVITILVNFYLFFNLFLDVKPVYAGIFVGLNSRKENPV